jgi:hypothetical protein
MTEPAAKIVLEMMGEPTEIEVSSEHAVLEYQVEVNAVHPGKQKIFMGVETIQIGWKKGDSSPTLVMIKSEAAHYLLQDPDVLSDLKEAVAYQKDLLREMN